MIQHDQLSFLPEDFLARKMRQRAAFAGIGALIGVLAVLTLLTLRARAALRAAEQRHALTQRTYDDSVERFARLCQQRDARRKIVQHAALASALIERVPPSNILAELTNRLPAGACLVDLALESHPRVEPAAATATAFDMKKAAVEARQTAGILIIPQGPATDVAIKISGLANTDVDVAHYLSELHRSPLFGDVSLLLSELYPATGKAGKSLRRFQIQMSVNTDARLTPRSEHPEQTRADASE